jgi:putative phosphoribosyl transferase
LLFDLLDEREANDRSNVFDIELLAERLKIVAAWVRKQEQIQNIAMGYFGASTGAGAALVAAAAPNSDVKAVVSRGGRPDLAENSLPLVRAPTLLIVGGGDEPVIQLNRLALNRMCCERQLKIVPGATHLFSEPGTLEEAARLASEWFQLHLTT